MSNDEVKPATDAARGEVASCSNCTFWKHEKCLRFPPTPVSQTWSKTEGSAGEYREAVESSVVTAWPETFPHDWCGEHKGLNT